MSVSGLYEAIFGWSSEAGVVEVATYVCEACQIDRSGCMCPQENVGFTPSQIVSGVILG